ncbi:MASE1 domain-containing protein [Candidatus Kaiserbacteria bacterium]|nr:MASE1 domain-containing protein [Candidatus Kaiserbacteria bacterium]
MPHISGTPYVVVLLIVFGTYLGTALLGLSVQPVNTFATLIWPPAGIAIASLTLGGYRLWPAVFLAAFLANFYTGAPAAVAWGIGVGNTFEALAGSYILRNLQPRALEFSFGNLRETLVFAFGAALGASLISATIGVGSLALGGVLPAAEVERTWIAWWVGNVLGVLIVAPFLLRWLSEPFYRMSFLRSAEIVGVAAASGLVAWLVFWHQDVAAPYPVLVPLVWAALRTGPRGTTLAILVVAGVAIAGTLAGSGPFFQLPLERALLQLQLFLGTVTTIFLVFTAIVEDRRRAADTLGKQVDHLENLLERLRAEDQAKNEFIATLAHELRNPLSPIVSTIELLKRGEKVDIARQASIMEKHAKSLSSLLNDLLDVSRISAQKLEIEKKPVYLGASIAQAVESVEPLMQEKNHILNVSINPRPILLEADPVRLEQIVTNLLSNAAKYTPAGGTITLSATREGSQAVIVMQDTGIGIEAPMLTRIFEPFLQIKRANSAEAGIGVGLAVTKKLIELHGGTIEAKSEGTGKGSEFTVRLPLPPHGAFVKETRKEAARRQRPLSPLRILVVDDNVDAANALGKLLGIRGHEVTLAQDGTSALRIVPLLKPDVVVLDIGLPDFDGYEVARRLKKAKFEGPLIALTGYGQDRDKKKTKEAGFAHHLTKPVSLAAIEEALSKVVSGGLLSQEAPKVEAVAKVPAQFVRS